MNESLYKKIKRLNNDIADDFIVRNIYKYRKNFSTQGTIIPIAGLFKTGSTFVEKVINNVLETELFQISSSHDSSAICEKKLLINYKKTGARHIRLYASELQYELMKKYDITPLFMTRNIFDSLISVKDHINNDNWLIQTGLYIPRYFRELSDEEQNEVMISIVLPYSLNIYNPWLENKNNIKFKFIKYENMLENKLEFFIEIFDFYGLNVESKKIKEIINKLEKDKKDPNKGIRFNKGIKGRGKNSFSPEQIERIYAYLNQFKYDYSDIV